jgi:hypothetical protein
MSDDLAVLIEDMDVYAEEVIFNDMDGMARVLADQWQAIRRIGQSEGIDDGHQGVDG